jgi:hypothetical protein
MQKKWNIGDIVIDEDENKGVVCICWNDGDICTIENDAAHPNPLPQENIKPEDIMHNIKDRLSCFFCGRDLSQAMNVQYIAEGPICSMCLGRISHGIL